MTSAHSPNTRCSFLETCPHPAFFLAVDAVVLGANDPGEKLLADKTFVEKQDGRLQFNGAPTQTAFLALLADEGKSRAAMPIPSSPAGEDAPPHWLLLLRVAEPPDCAKSCREKAHIIAIVRLSNASPASAGDLLISALGFTRTEADLSLALAFGATVSDFATSTGRRAATVRWHLKNALRKARCLRQADLVRIVLLLSL